MAVLKRLNLLNEHEYAEYVVLYKGYSCQVASSLIFVK